MPRTLALLLALALSLTGLGAAIGTASAAGAGGYITGTVTGPTGQPMANVWVDVTYWRADWESWEGADTVQTDASGHYQSGPLPANTYRVTFTADDGNYPVVSWPDDITLTDGQTVTGIDARFVLGGSISGTVTGPSGNPVDAMFVHAWRWLPELQMWSMVGAPSRTSLGDYEIKQLVPGRYRVYFEATTFQPEFYRDAATVETATDVTVVGGQVTTGIDAQLAAGVHIFGTVTDPDTHPVSGIDVLAWRWNSISKAWDYRATARTGAGGTYDLRGIGPGTYRVQFSGIGTGWTTEFWDDAASMETATDVTIDDTSAFDVDAQLSDVDYPSISSAGAPTIGGTAQVGRTLTATPGSWSPSTGLGHLYQWFRGNVPITGATAPTYTPTATDIGKVFKVQVTAFKAGYLSTSSTSAATAAVIPAVVANTSLPSVTGTPVVGATLTASAGSWNPSDAAVGYQWLLDGQPVAGATTPSYPIRASDLGHSLSVRVAASKTPWTSSTATSAAVTVGAGTITATTKPKLTGKAKKNAVLKVSPGTWSPAGSVKIQWYAGAKAIRKATAAKLKLAGKTLTAVRKKVISVRVTVAAPGYTTVVTTLKLRGKVR